MSSFESAERAFATVFGDLGAARNIVTKLAVREALLVGL
jgi:hypothetical protein